MDSAAADSEVELTGPSAATASPAELCDSSASSRLTAAADSSDSGSVADSVAEESKIESKKASTPTMTDLNRSLPNSSRLVFGLKGNSDRYRTSPGSASGSYAVSINTCRAGSTRSMNGSINHPRPILSTKSRTALVSGRPLAGIVMYTLPNSSFLQLLVAAQFSWCASVSSVYP